MREQSSGRVISCFCVRLLVVMLLSFANSGLNVEFLVCVQVLVVSSR